MSVEVPDVAQYQLLYSTNQGVQAINSFYMRNTVIPWTNTALEVLITDAIDAWVANIKPITHTSISLIGARARDIGTDPYGNVLERILDAPEVGVVSSTDAFPYFSCGVVQIHGDTGGEPKRSYIRYLGVNENQATANMMQSGGVSAIKAAWEGFWDDVQAGAASRANVIVSTIDAGAPRAVGVSNTFASISVRSALGRAVSRAGFGA